MRKWHALKCQAGQQSPSGTQLPSWQQALGYSQAAILHVVHTSSQNPGISPKAIINAYMRAYSAASQHVQPETTQGAQLSLEWHHTHTLTHHVTARWPPISKQGPASLSWDTNTKTDHHVYCLQKRNRITSMQQPGGSWQAFTSPTTAARAPPLRAAALLSMDTGLQLTSEMRLRYTHKARTRISWQALQAGEGQGGLSLGWQPPGGVGGGGGRRGPWAARAAWQRASATVITYG